MKISAHDTDSVQTVGMLFVSVSILLVTLLGNLTVMIRVLIRERSTPTVSNKYISSLVTSDFIMGVLVMPGMVLLVSHGYWPLGSSMCSVWIFLNFYFGNVSILRLCLIAYDRYLAIVHPLRYRCIPNPRFRAYKLIGVTWCVACVAASTLTIVRSMAIHTSNSTDEHYYNYTAKHQHACHIDTPSYYALFHCLLTFHAPAIIMLYMYVKSHCRLKGQLKLMMNKKCGFGARRVSAGELIQQTRQRDIIQDGAQGCTVNTMGPFPDGETVKTTRPLRDGESVNTTGPLRDGESVNTTGPLPDGESVNTTGPLPDGESVNTTGPLRDGESVNTTGPLPDGESVNTTGPLRDGESVNTTGPLRDGESVNTTGPLRDGESVNTTGPLPDGKSVNTTGPLRDGESVNTTGPLPDGESVNTTGPLRDGESVNTTGPLPDGESVNTTGPLPDGKSVNTTGPLRDGESVNTTGPLRDGESVNTTGPLPDGESVNTTGPLPDGESVNTTGPLRDGESVNTTGPLRDGESVNTTGPLRDGESVNTTGPLPDGKAVNTTGPLRDGESVNTTGPLPDGESVNTTGPLRDGESVNTTGPLRDGESVNTTGPLPDGESVNTTQPLPDGKSFNTTGPLRDGESVNTTGPLPNGESFNTTGPLRDGESVNTTGPLCDGESVDTTGPLRDGKSVNTTAPLRDGESVNTTGPLRDGESVNTTGPLRNKDHSNIPEDTHVTHGDRPTFTAKHATTDHTSIKRTQFDTRFLSDSKKTTVSHKIRSGDRPTYDVSGGKVQLLAIRVEEQLVLRADALTKHAANNTSQMYCGNVSVTSEEQAKPSELMTICTHRRTDKNNILTDSKHTTNEPAGKDNLPGYRDSGNVHPDDTTVKTDETLARCMYDEPGGGVIENIGSQSTIAEIGAEEETRPGKVELKSALSEKRRCRGLQRSLRILGLMITSFMVCSLPFSICWPIWSICPTCISYKASSHVFLLLYINASTYPFIYLITQSKVKHRIIALFRCK